MTVVMDASAVMAFLNDEPGSEKVAPQLEGALISAVNFCEIGSKLTDFGVSEEELWVVLDALALEIVPFDRSQADNAIAMRTATRAKGLSLADRACLSLGARSGATVLTADRAWAGLEVGCPIEVIR